MQTDNLYEEKVFPKVEMWILGVATTWVFFQLVYQIFTSYPPYWPLFLALLALIIIMYKFTFRKLNIKMTSETIIVKYGFGKRAIPWEKIDDCYLDKSSIIRYGGFGLRMGRVKGKWRDVYNVIGYPRVALSLKDAGFFKEFVFSTKNPEEVMKIINEKIKKI